MPLPHVPDHVLGAVPRNGRRFAEYIPIKLATCGMSRFFAVYPRGLMGRQREGVKTSLTAVFSNSVDYQLGEKRGRIGRRNWVWYTLWTMITSTPRDVAVTGQTPRDTAVGLPFGAQLIMTSLPGTCCSRPGFTVLQVT
jgi:hypothetical protein